ncbi:hypothetical protein FB451DRAFT_1556750 [Mycena latifolia]|nr:hypothetical protein FB451DRAFT_93204 [Mycena latifolia]KAJ7478999.1 hypothetical protein FB451DRAFT_1556750 [Mycena latifolia]
MVALAQELVDAIIDELGAKNSFENQDYASLHACSLVARAFVAPTQRYLFRRLALTRQNRALSEARPKVAQRSAALRSNPHLATYVRDLTLQIDLFSDNSPLLISLLPLLTSIKRLAIRDGARKWGELPADIRAAIVSLFSLQGLRCVALDRISDVPASLIRFALSSFKEVSLTFIYISDDDGDFPSAHQLAHTSFPSPAVLGHLALDYPPAVSTALHVLLLGNGAANPLGRLRHLQLTLRQTPDLGAFASIALKYSHSIQHLSIDFQRLPWKGLEFPSLPQLRVLTLKTAVDLLQAPNSVLLAIATLPSCMPNIEVMNILIHANEWGYSDSIRRPEADAALMQLSQLREVHFHVVFSYESGDITGFESGTRQKLHLASRANMLTFSNWGYKDPSMDFFSDWHPPR